MVAYPSPPEICWHLIEPPTGLADVATVECVIVVSGHCTLNACACTGAIPATSMSGANQATRRHFARFNIRPPSRQTYARRARARRTVRHKNNSLWTCEFFLPSLNDLHRSVTFIRYSLRVGRGWRSRIKMRFPRKRMWWARPQIRRREYRSRVRRAVETRGRAHSQPASSNLLCLTWSLRVSGRVGINAVATVLVVRQRTGREQAAANESMELA